MQKEPQTPQGPACDPEKRRLLLAASGLAGAGVVAGMSVPFVTTLLPPEPRTAAGAPIEVDLSVLEPGRMLSLQWNNKPLWILRRTPEMLAALQGADSRLLDPHSTASEQPAYCRNPFRSINPEVWVAEGLCTHMGCIPIFSPQRTADWAGGFVCPCHAARFDLAGRVFAGSVAPRNLTIPSHCYLSANRLRIGGAETPA
ncbi:ubiquinol-cytochrome c reductase iron-sulfur subunit [Formivibrio citricus]|uniref:Ubiquinol-cytochrome c reductase iron-sulfur subunit n=1 Tax=Formivibrio citricus TaxID=83765 RepID=A0A1I4XVD0_9NEIS|nr:ubiquinol-cytochrome c reductase iron-sulfur subunit [Formivibrio citricus]SFN29636.1 ubiquinol-cytochrome c reductase iron-sulfur subunit [Formivibrio citricus]